MISADGQLDENPFPFMAQKLHAGEEVCLLVVVAATGSTPQKTGACAVVGDNGLLWGSVGGGRLEGDAIERARTAREAFVMEIDLAEDYAPEAGPICGGRMTIFGCPITQRSQEIIDHLAARESGFVAFDLAGGFEWGEEKRGEYFLQLRGLPQLVIVGAGHCGRAIAELGHWLGFQTTVIDERPDLLEASQFPDGVRLIDSAMEDFPAAVGISTQSYIVLVSMGHQSDARALEACLDSKAAYIGMIGSRRKVGLLRHHFLERNIATPEQWERISTPIGLKIGAKTIREIATSVMAEIIAARRQGA